MQRLPALIAFALFIALCASLAYWLLQWLAPPPRPVAAPVTSERSMPPVAAAANLFGGTARGSATVNVQLRGIVHAGRKDGSVAILAVDGQAPRAYRVPSMLVPGVTLKAIEANSVVLSERGADRELALPAFAAQEGGMSGAVARALPEPAMPAQPQQQVQLPPPQLQGQGQGPGQAQAQAQAAPPPVQGQMPQAQALPPTPPGANSPAYGPGSSGSTAAGAGEPPPPARLRERSATGPR